MFDYVLRRVHALSIHSIHSRISIHLCAFDLARSGVLYLF
jgi:hypothetical protein